MADNVTLVTRMGSATSVPAADADALVRSGDYRQATPEEAAEHARQEQYGGVGHQLLAGVAGAARGATLGASDVALSELGGDGAREALAAYRDIHPLTSIGGEVAGSFVGAGKGATMLGKAAGARVGGGLVGGVVGAGVDGAIFGAGQGVTELALSDDPVTGERMAATMGKHIGTGAAMGAGLVGGIGLIGAGARKVGGGLKGALGYVRDGATGARLADTLDAASSALNGHQGGALSGLLKAGPEGRRMAVDGAEMLAARGDEVHGALEGIKGAFDVVADNVKGGRKFSQVSKLIERGNESATYGATRAMFGDLRTKLDDIAAGHHGRKPPKWLRDLRGQVDSVDDMMEGAVKSADGEMNAKLFDAIDDIKRDWQRQTMKMARKRTRSTWETKAWGQLKGAADDTLKPFLENQKLWGKAGALQSKINRPWSSLIKVLNGEADDIAVGFDRLFTQSKSTWDGRQSTILRDKVGQLLEGVTDPNNSQALDVIRAYRDRARDFVEAGRGALDLSPADRKAIDMLDGAVAKLDRSLDETVEIATRRNQLKMLTDAEGKGTLAAGALGGAIGAGLLGPGTGMGIAALSRLSQPGSSIRQLAQVEGLLSKYGGMVDESAGRLLRGATGLTKRGLLLGDEVAGPGPKPGDRYTQRARELRAMSANPDQVRAQVGATLAELAPTAPVATEAAMAHLVNNQLWLAQQLPKAYRQYPLSTPQPIGEAKAYTFMRLHDAVMDPVGTLVDRIEDGTLDKGTTDAIRERWPNVFEDMRNRVLEEATRAADEDIDVPHDRAVMMSVAFGLPLVATLEPGLVAMMQSAHAMGDPMTQDDTAPAPRRPADMGDSHEGALTPAQKLERDAA